MKPNNNQYYKGHKYKIYPTQKQIEILENFFDLYRFVYNWGIAKEKEIYEKYKKGESEYQFYSHYDLNKIFIEYRKDKEWLQKLPTGTAYNALYDVVRAYELFFKGINDKPHFKKKNKSKKIIQNKKR